MILITGIKTKEVRGDRAEIHHWNAFNPKERDTIISHEWINGKYIVTPDGREICLGMDRATQELLGLPFDLIDNQAANIRELQERCINRARIIQDKTNKIHDICASNRSLRNKLSNITNMSIWKRILFVFLPIRTLKGV